MFFLQFLYLGLSCVDDRKVSKLTQIDLNLFFLFFFKEILFCFLALSFFIIKFYSFTQYTFDGIPDIMIKSQILHVNLDGLESGIFGLFNFLSIYLSSLYFLFVLFKLTKIIIIFF